MSRLFGGALLIHSDLQLIMQLLRDNLTLWTSDIQENAAPAEEKPAEESKPEEEAAPAA